jgi:endonuclease III
MDIKPDDPTRRVLYRLGISDSENEKDAIEATRRLNPDYPGEFDGILWLIGRTWCHPSNPDCQSCCMTNVCAKRID